ncbi:N-acetylglucosaminyl-phosphatidylinositol de-N-acetylase isoform X2 [Petromyzon marinus]|uniref:N-acetylglucosaminylphosphatidylinositol deacetylase n=1 Tax=Petromyzon marinus TaxID=7757 RepID=A0AAJ7TT81_PETMA|nr:N-acetylglucosaminyl-phosphatidylinositol de-N-acetylase isoform X2 [Petromyzon marinus]
MWPQSPLLVGLLGVEGALLGLMTPLVDSAGPLGSWLLLLVSLVVVLSLASPVWTLLTSWCLHVALLTRLTWLVIPWPLVLVPVGALLGLVALVALLAFVVTRRHDHHHQNGPVGPALLLVTAHPDDECLFFSPAIQRLRHSSRAAHLLCLSTGNFYNQGNLREKELRESCRVLGIPNSRVTLVDRSELPDDPQVTWDSSLVADIILQHVEKHKIGLVLTFDAEGVSGHANHVSVYHALRNLQSQKRLPSGCRTLYLQSVSLLRKYVSIMDLPLSLLRSQALVCLASLDEYEMGLAMRCHRSQLVWFRWLYILFSRYMLINTFSEDGS